MKKVLLPERHLMTSWLLRALPAFVAFGAILAAASPANAAEIEIVVPSGSTVGEIVQVSATITDGGQPIVEAVVAVTRKAELAGTSGFVELDSGITDEAGVVALEFVQYAGSSEIAAMRIEYQGPNGTEAAEFELIVLPGPQQFASSSGADIGILNVSWLIVVIGLVWVSLIVATWQVLVISRARRTSKSASRVVPIVMVGFVAFTALGMFYVVLTQPTMHANLAPNEPFDRVPAAYLDQESDFTGLGLHDGSRLSDLSGEVLYVQAGCVSCHGVGGRGGVVGGELSVSAMSDTEEVVEAIRRGPKGMPVYSEHALSDEEIDRIIDHLTTAGGG
ncbi:MAG: c-type cytochrome [Acidimicrobiia bacterium]